MDSGLFRIPKEMPKKYYLGYQSKISRSPKKYYLDYHNKGDSVIDRIIMKNQFFSGNDSYSNST